MDSYHWFLIWRINRDATFRSFAVGKARALIPLFESGRRCLSECTQPLYWQWGMQFYMQLSTLCIRKLNYLRCKAFHEKSSG